MVTFYKLDASGVPMYPVLYLDTLKVSTIEQTAETTDARGGKGNAKLISWDYNKEINVTLEDALFSAKSLAIMFGDGNVKPYSGADTYIMKTEEITIPAGSNPTVETVLAGTTYWSKNFTAPDGNLYTKVNVKIYANNISGITREATDATNLKSTDTLTAGNTYFCTYDLLVSGSVIDVSANSFPGTYYITGDTFARSNNSGNDQFFQFIIPKAKVTSENTITLEAEGDPSVFNMSLTVLRPADGVMMKLVQYNLAGTPAGTVGSETTGKIYHNHQLEEVGEVAKG